MTKITEELLWRYIDGDCSEEEQQLIKNALAEDESLKEAMAERQALHAALKKIEEEEPSMRFATNVMENLPEQLWSWRPLVTRQLVGQFLLGLSGSIAICYLLAASFGPGSTSGNSKQMIGQVSNWSNQLFSSSFSSIIILSSVILICLYFFDKYLKNIYKQ